MKKNDVYLNRHRVSHVYAGFSYWVVDGTFDCYTLDELANACDVNYDFVLYLYREGKI